MSTSEPARLYIITLEGKPMGYDTFKEEPRLYYVRPIRIGSREAVSVFTKPDAEWVIKQVNKNLIEDGVGAQDFKLVRIKL